MVGDNVLKLFHNGSCSKSHEFFGCHKLKGGGYVFRVWSPHAVKVSVVGTFNGWNENSDIMKRLSDGESYEVKIPTARQGDRYKFCIFTKDERKLLKADPYSFCSDIPKSHSSVIYDLPKKVARICDDEESEKPINIYEVNLLSWKRHKDNSYYTFKELKNSLVEYVYKMGYTHVEFMPITEYPFDGSWGYQVTGYFCVTARLGTPADFCELVNAFHQKGIKVILDWVPAHFAKDQFALYEFDGQPLYECALWDKMEHRGWGTRIFDYEKGEVKSFLLSSANYFLDQFGLDGLRVDAVASMLYLSYDRKPWEWTPNIYGDDRNLAAIEFIKQLNATIKENFKSVITIAEESTSFPKVTQKDCDGGLGFDYKWNMGWMNDVLFYCRQDPLYRRYHHGKITFSMMYSFDERYILPLSHDEVVHIKGSIVNKMSGSYEDKFDGERLLLGFMYAHPGKKLNFMGYEVAQFDEWDYKSHIQFNLKKYEKHNKMAVFVKTLNNLYKTTRPLFDIENSWNGFEWLTVDDDINNVLAFNRYDGQGNCIFCVFNFSGIEQKEYKIGQNEGTYLLLFNSDQKKFGGEGTLNKRIFKTEKHPYGRKECTITIDIPRLTCLYFILKK